MKNSVLHSFLGWLVTGLVIGCSGNKESVSVAPIAECESYGTTLEACTGKLGAGAGKQRADETRAILTRAAVEAGDNEAAREQLRLQCAAGQRRLQSVCR
jgi:hypothetical protein